MCLDLGLAGHAGLESLACLGGLVGLVGITKYSPKSKNFKSVPYTHKLIHTYRRTLVVSRAVALQLTSPRVRG